MIKRLLLGWCSLSILIGAIIFFVEMEKVDDHVVSLAMEESKLFISGNMDYTNSIEQKHRDILLQRSMEHVQKGHFIIFEIYNKDKKKIVEAVRPQSELIEKALDKYKHDFLMTEIVNYQKFYIDKQIYLQILVPLKADGSGIMGYFEGIYQLDRKTMADIKKRIIWSLIQVVVVVLATTVMFYPVIIALNKDLIKFSVDLSKANIGMLEVLGGAIAKRDSDTNAHNYRVTIYAIRLAEAVGLQNDKIQGIIKGAFLHDVGKIGISDNILLKPGKLTNEEFEVMKTHVEHGVDIINKYHWLEDAINVVLYHHEKFDGSGYMAGLKGEKIPVNARIFAIADVFDALTSKRPYKDPFSFEKSLQILKESRGKHFDPELLDAFIEIAEPL